MGNRRNPNERSSKALSKWLQQSQKSFWNKSKHQQPSWVKKESQ